MMRKLLIFMLVLGIASLAQAGFVIVDNYSVDGTVDIDAASPGTESTDNYFILGIDSGTLTGGSVHASTPVDLSSLVAHNHGAVTALGLDGWFIGIDDGTASAPFAAGNYFENFVVTTTGGWVYFLEAGGSLASPIDKVYIPEPMTIALLGLGGLFLRRRR